MSEIRLEKIYVQNYRSFGEYQLFEFTDKNKPVAIVGYNNAGKTNLLNAILYGITEKYVSKDTFSINDFHNRKISNIPKICTLIKSSIENKYDGKKANLTGYHSLNIQTDGKEIEGAKIESFKDYSKINKNWESFGANRYFNIFFINFHEIKKEISTQKTSWGNLTSFLAKHIKKIADTDVSMINKKNVFKEEVKTATKKVLEDSNLIKFIEEIKNNYKTNLRDNNCEIDFGLPDYEDIFLQMMFKIGLNGDKDNLIPIEHFGDGYISMFVMAIIQAIAESETDDKCLFLFEEPESFLHENHQEYFYKVVLCGLAEKGHQVIYTTHSDKMVDLFDTEGLIRLEFNENTKQTEKKYNKISEFNLNIQNDIDTGIPIIEMKDYNNYIKIIEPNLNKILFSRKVVLVEGPNDLMVYKHIIEKKIQELGKDNKYSETYLNFKNFVIIPHHGKITALILIALCKHLNIEYFVINDWDFEENFIKELTFSTEKEYYDSEFYKTKLEEIKSFNKKGEEHSIQTKKSMITTNFKLLNNAGIENIHFNIPKLEKVIGYDSDDKNSIKIYNQIKQIEVFDENIFPNKLRKFLEVDEIKIEDRRNNE